jgi:signal peptidase I
MEPEYQDEGFGAKLRSNLLEIIEFLAITIAILVIIRFFVAEPHKIDGNSMLPNFHHDDLILTNKLATKLSTLQRGEVVILKNPKDESKVFIKRVIGLPGEKVKLQGGLVYINGKVLAEPYLAPGMKSPGEAFLKEGEEVVVPQDQYFVMGDNRVASSDSREFGPIKTQLIIGQALVRYWPLSKFSLIQIGVASN